MTSQIYACMKLLKRSLLTTFLLCGSCAPLLAQGYVYTFEGFPGNPSGEAVLGIWVVTPIPEPQSLGLVVLGLAGLAFRLLPLRFGSGKDDSQDCNEITVQAYD